MELYHVNLVRLNLSTRISRIFSAIMFFSYNKLTLTSVSASATVVPYELNEEYICFNGLHTS